MAPINFWGPKFNEVWLSLVERYVRDVEAAGSNPVTSTKGLRLFDLGPFFFSVDFVYKP